MARSTTIGMSAALMLVCSSLAHGQQTATKDEITAAFVGKTATFDGGGEATYFADGSYELRASGTMDRGTYTIGDGRICVFFQNGWNRCDTILKEGTSFALVNSYGQKYSLTIR